MFAVHFGSVFEATFLKKNDRINVNFNAPVEAPVHFLKIGVSIHEAILMQKKSFVARGGLGVAAATVAGFMG